MRPSDGPPATEMNNKVEDLQDHPRSSPNDRLDSWKEIAAYLKCSERTVRRWEEEGLPVHRHTHKKKPGIYAYKAEIDVWWRNGHEHITQIGDAGEQHSPALPLRSPWLATGLALSVVLVVLVAFAVFQKHPAPRIQSLAVLPLDNLSRDPEQEYFADGMTDTLITDLAQIGSLKVISRTSSMRYKQSRKPLPQIAQELGVDGIVEGTVQRAGDRVRVTAQLIHGPSDKHIWAHSYDRELGDTLGLQKAVARDIAEKVSANLAGPPGEHASYVVNPIAYDDYLKGRSLVRRWTNDADLRGIEYLERSLQNDPNYAPTYAELSAAFLALGTQYHSPPKEVMPRAKSAALKALDLNDNLAEAHVYLGRILGTYELNWVGAEREFRRALELDPNSSLAHAMYAYYFAIARTSEAKQNIKTALELDPFSPEIHSAAAGVFILCHEYESAIGEARRALEIDPSSTDAYLALAGALGRNGKPDEAFTEWLQYLSLGGDPELAQELAVAAKEITAKGDPGQKLAHITLRYYQRKMKKQYVSALRMVEAYQDLGDKEKTLEWLDKAYDERSPYLFAIVLDSSYDSLRTDPRFQELLRRMNLHQNASHE